MKFIAMEGSSVKRRKVSNFELVVPCIVDKRSTSSASTKCCIVRLSTIAPPTSKDILSMTEHHV